MKHTERNTHSPQLTHIEQQKVGIHLYGVPTSYRSRSLKASVVRLRAGLLLLLLVMAVAAVVALLLLLLALPLAGALPYKTTSSSQHAFAGKVPTTPCTHECMLNRRI